MIRSYRVEEGRCACAEAAEGIEAAPSAAWIDLLEPTHDEERAIEGVTGANVPTPEEMAEIEASSRLYLADGVAIMTAPLLIKSAGPYPETTDVTFVLTERHLVTVRYAEPTAFETFAALVARTPQICAGPEQAFAGLVDAIADRLADVLEEAGRQLDALSRAVFSPDEKPSRDFHLQMQTLGRNGDIVSKARESLVGIARMVGFAREIEQVRHSKAVEHKLRTVARDVEVLREHAGSLASKTSFLLEALLGMINIEQNAMIKIFSVVAVMFLPPTLIASAYGMNFEHMPELGWPLAYPVALAAMALSMVLPYLYFRRRGWI
ncbi:MAG TPA: magnesium transporter CorA family protein [Thermohalobaculum sp.]|nr:magnesium transporter CorA family protein [Thermohalobaculum sp.]